MLKLDKSATRRWLELMTEKPSKFKIFCEQMEEFARSKVVFSITTDEAGNLVEGR